MRLDLANGNAQTPQRAHNHRFPLNPPIRSEAGRAKPPALNGGVVPPCGRSQLHSLQSVPHDTMQQQELPVNSGSNSQQHHYRRFSYCAHFRADAILFTGPQ